MRIFRYPLPLNKSYNILYIMVFLEWFRFYLLNKRPLIPIIKQSDIAIQKVCISFLKNHQEPLKKKSLIPNSNDGIKGFWNIHHLDN